jgi:hypothetical protein
MTRTTILTSLLLFGAAFGWVRNPPPVGRESRTVQSILSADGARRLRERTIPLGCAVLGLACLVFGWNRRETAGSRRASLTPPAVC